MGRIVDAILGLSGGAAYALVGLLAFGEAAAFVGLFLPGELAVLLGGVVVSEGHASLGVMILVASVAAIAGDSVGYEVGRRFGPRIMAWPLVERRFASKVATATAYLEAKGGRAVFLGRWTSLLRALLPGLAGMVRMPYRRFLLFNVIGGVAWATTFVLLGYVAGSSWRQVEKIAGRASVILLLVVLTGLLIRSITRRLAARAEDVRALLARVAQWPLVVWVRTTFAAPLQWLGARAAPGAQHGLGWSLSLMLTGLAAWIVGIAVQDVLNKEELALLDRPVADWIASNTTPSLAAVAESVVHGVGSPWGVLAIVTLGLVGWRAADRAAGLRVLVAGLLGAAAALTLHGLLPISATGTLFPSVPMAALTASLVSLLPAIARRTFATAIRAAGLSLALILALGLLELVAGHTALSGLVGALGVGALIGLGGELTTRTVAAQTADLAPAGAA